MKLCFPTTHNQGMESQVFEHFGSAPMFLLVDSKHVRSSNTQTVTKGTPTATVNLSELSQA